MDRSALVPVMAVAIVNGIFSPFVITVFLLHPVWYPGFLPPMAPLIYMMSALILATLTIMVSGVPAALYERFAPSSGGHVSRVIWLAGALLISMPALPNVMRALGIAAD